MRRSHLVRPPCGISAAFRAKATGIPVEMGICGLLPKPNMPFPRKVTVAFKAKAAWPPVEMEPCGSLPLDQGIFRARLKRKRLK